VRQVVRHVDAIDGRREGRRLQEVGCHDACGREPVGQRAGVAAHEDEVVALRVEEWNEAAADVPAGADDEDAHGTSIGGLVGRASCPSSEWVEVSRVFERDRARFNLLKKDAIASPRQPWDDTVRCRDG
jgi:hypothetical protein